MKISTRTKNWLLVAAWMAAIFAFSQMPSKPTLYFSDWKFIARKLAHVTEYFILGILLARALIKHRLSRRGVLILTILIGVLYAISDEYHQTFIFGRDGTLMDISIDSCGVFLAAWLKRKKMVK